MAAAVRAALYLRVSTGRQAENDLSIPDQRRQAKGYCTSRGWEIVADYVEPGVSATDDKRPEFQRMIDAATTKPPAFEVVLVHSFSRFFRDQFQLEFYVRRLAKAGVRLVSITQELGDDPMSNMIRQIMALFDEYQSRENAKHTLRAMKENARQGFWNGALPPIGYRIVEAAEQRGHRTKKTLEVDPIQAETAPRVVSGPTLLTGICFCAACGGAMTLRTGKSGKYRYYTCCTKVRQGETGCKGRTVPMEKLDSVVAEHIERRLLQPKRLEQILSAVLHRREERAERRTTHIAELRKRAAEAEAKLKRLYDAIENGIADVSDPLLKERVTTELKPVRDQASADAERVEGALDRAG